jgi:hypothetical protein
MLQRRVICSEALLDKNGGVFRVLLTALRGRKPQYALLNLFLEDDEEELKAGKTYRITIEEE